MYLTKVQISLDDALRARLTDAYTWHQQLWTTFPGRDGEPRDFLTRVDQQEGIRVARAVEAAQASE